MVRSPIYWILSNYGLAYFMIRSAAACPPSLLPFTPFRANDMRAIMRSGNTNYNAWCFIADGQQLLSVFN